MQAGNAGTQKKSATGFAGSAAEPTASSDTDTDIYGLSYLGLAASAVVTTGVACRNCSPAPQPAFRVCVCVFECVCVCVRV